MAAANRPATVAGPPPGMGPDGRVPAPGGAVDERVTVGGQADGVSGPVPPATRS
ncbi:hypothetical protein [Actinokineospora spheciospongiae]|uniref:hypothetical protein n=1 Tax=Actinokineospora spheciospongiae TaxID=909613 RepID=UPI0015E8601A|nr:hypothetical protein [Actinokineospora spheciospongiae]